MKREKKFIERINLLFGNLTPSAYAKKICVDAKTMQKAARGLIPGLKILIKICETESCTVSWLIGETDTGGPVRNKIPATISPGKPDKINSLIEASKLPTVIDGNLIMIVNWMNEYFYKYREQTPEFLTDLSSMYPSLKRYIEKNKKLRKSGDPEKKYQVSDKENTKGKKHIG